MLDRAPQPNPEYDTATPDPAHSWAPYQVLNIGNHGPAGLLEYIDALEEALGKKTERNYLPMQPGDVPATFADTTLLTEWTGHKPGTPIREGIGRFVEWYVPYCEGRLELTRAVRTAGTALIHSYTLRQYYFSV